MKIILIVIVFQVILFSAPLNESFTSTGFPPIGWRVINNDGGQQIWGRDTNNPRTLPACVSSRYESNTLRNDDWLITPKLICSSSTADSLKFWYRKAGGGNPESLEVWLSNTTNNIIDFTIRLWKTQFTTTTYTQKVIPLDSFDGQEIYIAFVNKALYGNRLNLDDIAGPEMSEIIDVGVDSVLCPSSFIMRPFGIGFYPQARIRNYSNATQRNIPVICSIVGPSSVLRYQSIKYIDSLLVDNSKIISFDLFIPNIAELCTIKVRTYLANDSNLTNNIKTATTQITHGQYTGGSDDGFYYWIDSDTSGGPVYNWVDISQMGSNLPTGNEYISSPIPIDFIFNYYGDPNSHFRYSTNGFVSFSDLFQAYNFNAPIPNANFPNNIIAPFWDDLWTIGAWHQTFGLSPNRYKIIQWNAIVYPQALRDTVIFQLILYENSDIVFQYNRCSNRYNLGQGQTATVGIENNSGTTGLQYLYNGTQQGNLLSAGRAIKFYRSCHDVMLDTILTEYVGITDTIFPKAVVKNIGTFPETFSTVLNIRNNTQTLIYADTLDVINLLPTAKCTLEFKRWTPTQLGTYPAKAWTTLTDDVYPFNDTCRQDIIVTLAAPGLFNPSNGYITNNQNILFDWTNVSQASRYNLVIDGVIDTVLSFSQYGPRTFSEASFSWRVRAGNYNSWGLWSETYTFTIDTTRPFTPILISPINNCTLSLPRPNFIWRRVGDAAQYHILIYSLYDTITNQIISDTSYTATQAIPNGKYFWKVRCCDLAGNWSDYSQIRTLMLQYQVWYQKADLPEANSFKPVGFGGAITSSDNRIYALKGNNTQDFYAFDIASDQWCIEQPIPYHCFDSLIIKRKVKDGGALAYGDGLVFAIKGNNTKEFWVYNPSQDSWLYKQPIPSKKSLRQGSCLTYYNGSVYCLVGNSNKFEFFRYDVLQNLWIVLSPALEGRYKKRFRAGTAMIYGGNEKIYVLKGGSRLNEFYVYDIGTNYWQEKESLPYFHPMIQKKTRVKSGGALTYDGQNSIYAIKGGGENEFWKYNINTGQWLALETVPRLNKRSVPKSGAGLTYVNSEVWLMKGNKTREFWVYQTSKSEFGKTYHRDIEVQSIKNGVYDYIQNDKQRIVQKMVVMDNCNSVIVNCNIPNPGQYVLKCYDLNGRLIKNIEEKFLNTGIFEQKINLDKSAKGVYFIVVERIYR